MKKSDSMGFSQFSQQKSPHLSRILRNTDISNELALSQDITFDQEILDQHKHRAASVIQRWFKGLLQDRLHREAEEAIQEAKRLAKLRKEIMVKNYVECRESMNDPHAVWKGAAQKENFSLYAHVKPSDAKLPKQVETRVLDQADVNAKDGDEGENKLKGLNDLLKGKDFSINQEDEADFEKFMALLRQRR